MTHPRGEVLDLRTPVIAGVGVASPRVGETGGGLEALELMLTATRAAGLDSGAPAILRAVERIAVPHGTWGYSDPGRLIAQRIGAERAKTVLVGTGIPQQTLFNDAYMAIREGQLDVVLIVGGEAAGRAALARRRSVPVVDTVQDDVPPDDLQLPTDEIITQVEIDGGVSTAMQPFALVDSALRSAEGRSLDQHRDEIARLWAGFNRVAAGFPPAAFPQPRAAAFLREPSAANRPFAFPYNKWHCAQMNVDQAAALLVCSLGAAQRLGVDPERMIFPLVALESSFSLPVPRRRDLHRWCAMEELGRAAVAHLGHPLSAIPLAEIYSCYPAAVRIQQRALGLPPDGVPTITGGETFAGGPWNNFVLQTTAAMVERLRSERGAKGLVSTVSGIVNKPGLAIYAAEPGPAPLLVADLADQAKRATGQAELIAGYHGPARVVAYTATYHDLEPTRCTIIADTPAGLRCMASSDDAVLARRVTQEELIGTTVGVDGVRFVV